MRLKEALESINLGEDDTRCIDPFSGKESVIKQYSIEIDWDEVRIIKERNRVKPQKSPQKPTKNQFFFFK